MDIRRFAAPALGVALLVAVGGGIWYSNTSLVAADAAREARRSEQANQVTVRGLIGSEKEAFFADVRVKAALAARGIAVVPEKAGSRAIAGQYDASRYDFGFPSGAPAGTQLRLAAKAPAVYTPFYTPIVIASWRPIAAILVANGVAERTSEGTHSVDLARLLALIEKGTRWNELKASQAFPTGKSLLLNSTDVRSSNSAAMYLALASYVANGEQVVQSAEEADRVLPRVAPLFLRQGFQETSSAGPFEDYLALGMGKAPLLVAYESQMVEFWMKQPDRVNGDMMLLYPRPTVYSKHVFVPYTPAGDRLGQALDTDPQLRSLAHEYGFRTSGEAKGPELWASRGINVPPVLVDVVDPPSYEWLERMIRDIEARFR